MGELFNNQNEFKEAMVNQWFDYIRIHVSQIGGVTPAMKVARLGEWFNIKTAWHGPGDVSPVAFSLGPQVKAELYEVGYRSTLNFLPTKLAHSSGRRFLEAAPEG